MVEGLKRRITGVAQGRVRGAVQRVRALSVLFLLVLPSWLTVGLLGLEGTVEGAESGRARVLDRIVMVINGEPITASRVELYAAWLKLWGNAPGWPERVEPGGEWTPVEMERLLILDELLAEAASAGGTADPSDVELQAELTRYRACFGSVEAQEAFERRFELSGERLRGLLSRRLRVARLVSARLGQVRVSEGEVVAWYQAHAHELAGKSLTDARAGISAMLKDEQLRLRFAQWADELRARASIQVPSREAER